jgi:hypothetical protein
MWIHLHVNVHLPFESVEHDAEHDHVVDYLHVNVQVHGPAQTYLRHQVHHRVSLPHPYPVRE